MLITDSARWPVPFSREWEMFYIQKECQHRDLKLATNGKYYCVNCGLKFHVEVVQ